MIPDTKNWTWVLERTCPECRFDVASLEPSAVPAIIRSSAQAWQQVLGRPGVAERTQPDRWSPLEYACHVRDVFRVYDGRLARMLEEDDPAYDNWDQDATAVEDRYAEQNPASVPAELGRAAEEIARRFEAVGPRDWERTGRRSDGARFTIASLARYFIHDPVHHLHDVGVRLAR